VRSLEAGMSTRSTSDKSEVENLYKTAIEGKNKRKSNITHTSTPTSSSKIWHANLDDSEIVKESNSHTSTSEPDSDDSGDITIQPTDNSNKIISERAPKFKSSKMAQQNPFATLKYAVEAVPFFDGKNIPLNYFIEGCEEAKSMLPDETESQFTKIIRTRIVGEARRTIQGEDFDSVAQLTKYLKQIYGPSKNVYQLQGELGSIYQKNEEDVVTYANRVKILGKQILEAYKVSGNSLPGQNIKASLEKDMCKCFIRGLKPEIEQRIARDLDVQGTVADALRIERELRSISDLRQGQGTSNKTSSTNNSQEICQICYKIGHLASNCRKLPHFSLQTPNKNNLGPDILICQICKKRGHGADKCRLRDPETRQSIKIVQDSKITCQLCSKSGHNAKGCRINNVNNQIKPSVICQWCDKPGHSATNCWKKQNEQRNIENKTKTVCQLCNNFGHVAKDCRSKAGQNAASKDSLFCRYCKEQGHLLENCEVRIASNNRRKANEQGNSSGPSTLGVQQGSERISHPSTSQKSQ